MGLLFFKVVFLLINQGLYFFKQGKPRPGNLHIYKKIYFKATLLSKKPDKKLLGIPFKTLFFAR